MTKGAKKPEPKPKHTREYRDYTIQELKRLAYWFEGYAAAGGKPPSMIQTFNCLHKAWRMLEDVEVKE